MALTYKRRKPRLEMKEEYEEVTISAKRNWGMFTAAGNRRITTLAAKFLEEAEAAKGLAAFATCGEKFLKKYRAMSSYNSYREASDTAVREAVWSFFGEVGKAKGYEYDTLDTIWEEAY